MAPTAARRAKWVQRSCSQGLRGNPDACNPGRGSACNETTQKTGGDARPVFALPVQPTAAMNPRIGGSRVGGAPRPFLSHRFLWERKRCPGRAGPLREGGILYERATTGRPCGRRAESSRPTEPAVAEANGRIISAPANGETGGQYPLSQKVRRDAAPSRRGEIRTNCKLWRAAGGEAALSHCFLGRGGVKYHGLGMTRRPRQAANDTEGGQTL